MQLAQQLWLPRCRKRAVHRRVVRGAGKDLNLQARVAGRYAQSLWNIFDMVFFDMVAFCCERRPRHTTRERCCAWELGVLHTATSWTLFAAGSNDPSDEDLRWPWGGKCELIDASSADNKRYVAAS